MASVSEKRFKVKIVRIVKFYRDNPDKIFSWEEVYKECLPEKLSGKGMMAEMRDINEFLVNLGIIEKTKKLFRRDYEKVYRYKTGHTLKLETPISERWFDTDNWTLDDKNENNNSTKA